MKATFSFVCGVLTLLSSLPIRAQSQVHCTIQHEAEGMTNRVLLSWDAYQNSFYQVWTAMDLHHTWGLMKWVWATNDAPSPMPVSVWETNLQTRRFYTVVEAPVPEWLTNSSVSLLETAARYRLVYVPPGTFMMGSPETEAENGSDETQHEVMISRGFWMGKHEVTQGEYLEVVGTNPSQFSGMNLPVEWVSWYEATNYCALLTEGERLAGRLPGGYVYRLPTEAEWEYACRAGTTTSHHYGNELRSGMANFYGSWEYDAAVGTINNTNGIRLGRTTEVGSFAPNAWGFYDMHGNVREWCQDWYGEYPAGPVTDPQGPPSGQERVHRGGSGGDDGRFCRSALRLKSGPESRGVYLGFRVALVAVP
jgi:sulfatase modifying factor 1